MSLLQHQHDQSFAELNQQTNNKFQNLWKVHDAYMNEPHKRFIKGSASPYIDNVLNSGSEGPLTHAPIPAGLYRYVKSIASDFGVSEENFEYVDYEDVIFSVINYIDYQEPYFLFIDSPVQITEENFAYTYKTEKGHTLDPESIECFRVIPGWDFRHYRFVKGFMAHPMTREVMAGKRVPSPQKEGGYLTKMDVLKKIAAIVWGESFDFFGGWVDDWMFRHYENLQVDLSREEDAPSIDLIIQKEAPFWNVVSLAVIVWMKSPHAMQYLIAYHPIYGTILDWDEHKQHPVVNANSHGFAVVDGWEIHPGGKLNILKSKPPGSCEKCGNCLHCTKYVNARALFKDDCSCGKGVDPTDVEMINHGWDCKAKKTCFPAFVCQKCIFDAVNKKELMKCGRAVCPNTSCPWHMGKEMRLQALTKNRTLLIDAKPR